MGKYMIDKNIIKKTISYMEYDIEGYSFSPKSNTNKTISVKKVTIFQETLVNNLLINKFSSKFIRLSDIVFNIINDDNDTDEGDCMIVLDEIERLKAVLDIKIKKHLKIDEYNNYLDNLYFLKQQIENKIITLSNVQEEELTQNKGRSR